MSVQSQDDAVTRLKGKAEEFQKHAARLSEVARQSAAISADARRESDSLTLSAWLTMQLLDNYTVWTPKGQD